MTRTRAGVCVGDLVEHGVAHLIGRVDEREVPAQPDRPVRVAADPRPPLRAVEHERPLLEPVLVHELASHLSCIPDVHAQRVGGTPDSVAKGWNSRRGRAVAPRVTPNLSLLDLATVGRDRPDAEALAETVTLAQRADELDAFERLWFAEHHNMPRIASAATSVLIAHELHPGRIDLGLGRAPGTDGATMRALRTDPGAAESFPQDVRELQGYLAEESLVDGIHAYPGRGTQVPLYILGSSLFGAQLAAAYGLPYAFASHFAPDALDQAVRTYRAQFTPTHQLAEPHVIAAGNVNAPDQSA